MGAIQAGIALNEEFANVVNHVVSTVNMTIIRIGNIQEALSELTAPEVTIPVHWKSDGQEVFTGTGVDRFRQEVQSANDMLQQLCSTQDAIAKRAYNNTIFSTEAFQDLNSLAVRMDDIRDRIQQLENNPMNIGTDMANSELEQLRARLQTAVQEQGELNAAVKDMDVSAANEAYLKLSQTVGETESYIRDNVDSQGRFNQEVQEGAGHMEELADKVKGVVSSYVNMENLGKALDLSDGLVRTTASLDLVNDGAQTTQELMDMVYAAAQDAGGSFLGMADMVVDLGNNAGSAFDSSEEMVAFADLVQKQVVMSGASPQEGSGVMSQLSQGMSTGALGSGEVSTILDQAPAIARTIESSMGWAEGSILSYAEQGLVTAEVVKNAMFCSADEINARFGEMPATWEQASNRMRNTALMAFQPVLLRLNELVNSEAFQIFAGEAVEAMTVLAGILVYVLDMVQLIGTFIADNWSVISPIVYGIVAALAVYYGWILALNAIELVSKGIQLAVAAAKTLMAVATGGLTAATIAETGAQTGLNAALAACPIVWIIVLIIALIAIIFAVCNAIAKMTGVASSGFGVITGGLNVVIQFFKNLAMSVMNITIGIGCALDALGKNMIAAFFNAICSVKSFFIGLLATGLTVIEGLCEALNKLPFVEIDYSGISTAADLFAAEAARIEGSKLPYADIGDAFHQGMSTFDTFQDGWASDAFAAGAAWGDGIADGVGNFNLSDVLGGEGLPDKEPFGPYYEGPIEDSGLGDNVGSIAGDTCAIKDSMDIAQEDLKYLRDIAEQEAVNRYTLAEVKVEQTNHNNINGSMDLDGVVSGLTDAVNEAVANITEGVHA